MKIKQMPLTAVIVLMSLTLLAACAPETPAENPSVPPVSQETRDRLTTMEAPGSAGAPPTTQSAQPETPPPAGE